MCPRRSSTSIEIGVFGTRKGDRLKVLFRKWRSKLYLDGPVCSACGKELLAHIRGGLCPECEKTSVKLGTDICGKCGRVLANEAEFCDTCIRNERAFVRARSCYVYEGAPKKFVYRLKFGGRRYLAAFIAEAMVDRYLDCGFECDCVVAVPLSAKRKRKRGYNQAELVAEELSCRLKLPLIDGALVKTKENKPQTKLTRREREENVRGVYEVTSPETFKGRRVLVVDDVMTTGATLGEVSRVLYKAKARSVEALTYCSTRFVSPSENILNEEDFYEDEMV